jgi:hypothetical protein
VPVTQTLFYFNRRTNHPLGILPQFPITLGWRIVFIDVIVVHDPLDFDLLLGRDYVYAMKSIVSTLFHVISFLHDGRMVTIDQLSFDGPNRVYAFGITPATGQLCGIVSHDFNFRWLRSSS